MFIFAQVIGLGGLCFLVWSFQQNSRNKILTLQIGAALIFTLHFMLLGAMTGAFLNLSSVARNLVFRQSEKKWASSKWWMAVFILLFMGIGALTWQGIFSLFPVISCVLQTITFWMKNPRTIRALSVPVSLCWLVYNFANLSYAGMVTEAIALTSIFIAIVRFDLKKKEKSQHSSKDGV